MGQWQLQISLGHAQLWANGQTLSKASGVNFTEKEDWFRWQSWKNPPTMRHHATTRIVALAVLKPGRVAYDPGVGEKWFQKKIQSRCWKSSLAHGKVQVAKVLISDRLSLEPPAHFVLVSTLCPTMPDVTCVFFGSCCFAILLPESTLVHAKMSLHFCVWWCGSVCV